jgi:hypothetical protein
MGFSMLRVKGNTIDWAKQLALWLIMMAYALCTQCGVNLINQLTHINGFIGAYRFADITVNAFICNI